MTEVDPPIETAHGPDKRAAAAEKFGRVGGQLALILDSADPVRGRRLDHLGRLTGVTAAEAGDDEEVVKRELAVVLPSIIEIPLRFDSREWIRSAERGVRKRLSTYVVGQRAVRVEL